MYCVESYLLTYLLTYLVQKLGTKRMRSMHSAQDCKNKFYSTVVQWNLDLRKILGVDKIFLKSRFFLISNTGKPLKVTNKA